MAERRRRIDHGIKADRFAALRQRHARHPERLEALERRQRADAARLCVVRARATLPARPFVSTIERRRREYNDLPTTPPSLAPPRAALVSLAAAFVVPMLIAIITGIGGTHHTMLVALEARHRALGAARLMRTVEEKSGAIRARVANVRSATRPIVAAAPPFSRATGSHRAPAASARREPKAPPRPLLAAVTRAPSLSAQSQPVTRELAATPAPSKPAQPRKEEQLRRPVPATGQRRNAPAAVRVAFAPQPSVAPRQRGPWRLSPDGTWVATVRAPFETAGGAQFDTSTGQVIALERSPLDSDGAVVTIGWSRPVSVSISAGGQNRSVDLPAPDDSLDAFAATASAVGPHLVNIGWTPLSADSDVVDYKVYRTESDGEPQLAAQLSASRHSWSDTDVSSGADYSYDVVADTSSGAVEANTQTVRAPAELPATPASALAGKGMFLYFSSIAADERYYGRFHPEAVIAEAKKAGIRVIEVRMARGSCAMAQTPSSRAWLDRLIDSAAQSRINLVAWTVPRRVTTQDLEETLTAAAYRTPAGNGFMGVALDLETGERYMGDGDKAVAAMVRYIRMVREAAGPQYLIVATVASPEMGNHTNADYPYARIAAYADVLQPMEYWHYFEQSSHHEYARREVAGASAAAVARTRELAGRDIPVDVAGQSVALEGTGSPSGREIQWSLGGAKSAGGIGETFFDWAGTGPDAWAAIQAFDW